MCKFLDEMNLSTSELINFHYFRLDFRKINNLLSPKVIRSPITFKIRFTMETIRHCNINTEFNEPLYKNTIC